MDTEGGLGELKRREQGSRGGERGCVEKMNIIVGQGRSRVYVKVEGR